MPTGYTATLMESDQTFQDFVLLCARAFGACIMMRDEPMDAPIPQRFAPSRYNQERVAAANAELARLQSMTNDQKIAFGESRRSERAQCLERILKKEVEQNQRLEKMESLVKQWTPPTPDHAGLKEFMLDQLSISKHDTGYLQRSITETLEKSSMEYYAEAVKGAQRDIEYHTNEQIEEDQRAESRTAWVQQLRASIAAQPET